MDTGNVVKMIVFDWDGTVTPKRKTEEIVRIVVDKVGSEKLCRILFRIQEIFDSIKSSLGFDSIKLNQKILEIIKKAHLLGIPLGLITDRRTCIACGFLQKFELNFFSFIQGRSGSSITDHSCGKNTLCFESPNIKPSPVVFLRLCNIAKENGIERKKILYVDDQPAVRSAAENLGFKSLAPDDPMIDSILNPDYRF